MIALAPAPCQFAATMRPATRPAANRLRSTTDAICIPRRVPGLGVLSRAIKRETDGMAYSSALARNDTIVATVRRLPRRTASPRRSNCSSPSTTHAHGIFLDLEVKSGRPQSWPAIVPHIVPLTGTKPSRNVGPTAASRRQKMRPVRVPLPGSRVAESGRCPCSRNFAFPGSGLKRPQKRVGQTAGRRITMVPARRSYGVRPVAMKRETT